MTTEDDASIRRLKACLDVLRGITTECLEKIAKLDDAHRFGALSDLAKLRHIKAKRENAPYREWCRDPDLCAGKGYCPRDPNCGD